MIYFKILLKNILNPMVKAIKGIFVKTEPSIKEIIMKVADPSDIIEDINDYSLFLNPSSLEEIKLKVEKILNLARKE